MKSYFVWFQLPAVAWDPRLHRKLHKEAARVLSCAWNVMLFPPWEANHTFVQSIRAVLGLHGIWFIQHWLFNIRKGLLKPVGSTLASRIKLLRRAGEPEGRTAPYIWDCVDCGGVFHQKNLPSSILHPEPHRRWVCRDQSMACTCPFPTQHQVEPPKARGIWAHHLSTETLCSTAIRSVRIRFLLISTPE